MCRGWGLSRSQRPVWEKTKRFDGQKMSEAHFRVTVLKFGAAEDYDLG